MSKRFCGNYYLLNAQTRHDSFPMPLIDDVLDQLRDSSWFSTLDLHSRFLQISMALDHIKKTTIVTKSRLYEWNAMPFEFQNVTNFLF
jgi:hypothetical protein